MFSVFGQNYDGFLLFFVKKYIHFRNRNYFLKAYRTFVSYRSLFEVFRWKFADRKVNFTYHIAASLFKPPIKWLGKHPLGCT